MSYTELTEQFLKEGTQESLVKADVIYCQVKSYMDWAKEGLVYGGEYISLYEYYRGIMLQIVALWGSIHK